MESTLKRAAIWGRVSTEHQDTENQLLQLRALAEAHAYEIVRTYETEASAWTGQHRELIETALLDAWRGDFDVLVVWSLDRLSREGIEPTLRTLRRFTERGVAVISLQEPWLNGSSEVQELLTAIMAWVAKMESKRRSERVKAGLAKRQAAGGHIGRKKGAKDRSDRPRKKSGYYARWERERQRQERS